MLHLILDASVEVALKLEELVASVAETLIDAVVILLGCKADCLPHLLYLEQLLRCLIPILACEHLAREQRLGLLAQLLLQCEVLQLLRLQALEVLLVALVDAARCLLETLPQRLLELDSHGACLAPLVVQLLQLAEGLNNLRLESQLLGLLTEGELRLVVLLEVEVAQLTVNLDVVIEVLNMEVVGLPHILNILLGDETRLLPALLQLPKAREGCVDVLLRVNQLLQFVDDGELDFEVLLLVCLEHGDVLIALVAVNSEELFEAYLILIYRWGERSLIATRLNKGALLSLNLCTVLLVECYLNGLNNRTQCLHRLRLNLGSEQRNKLLLAQTRDVVTHGGRLLLFGCSLTHIEARLIGSKCRLLVGKGLAHAHLGSIGIGCKCCCLNIGSHLRIFGNSADRPLRSRKVDFLGSHRSLRF